MKIKFLLMAIGSMLFFNNSWAALPTVSCFLTDTIDASTLKEKTVFSTNAAMIYLMCTSDEVNEGQKIKAVWIAADTNGLAPNNYKIGEKSFDVKNNLDEKRGWTIKYSLSKPYAGWPPGQYHADLFVDGSLATSLKFQIDTSETVNHTM
jgi:hypothetical protein